MFDVEPLVTNWRFLGSAILTTLAVSAIAVGLGMASGLVIGLGRVYGGRLVDAVLGFYVDTFRAIPVLVVLIWMFFAFPVFAGLSLTPFAAGSIGLGLHIGVYFAETIRAGLLSVRGGQMRAAKALGMSATQAVRVVILPQALIRMLPAFGSLITICIKDSAVAAVIAVPELMRQSQVVAGQTYRPFPIYTFAMLVYFLMCFPLARLTDRCFRRLSHKGAS